MSQHESLKPVVWMRWEAPLMSFGGASIDSHSVTRRYPSSSMITGLIGNALGWHHRDAVALQGLQERLEFAVRADVPGRIVTDYQTVDLGLPHMLDERAWTTWGRLDTRAGGNSKGTHIRQRDYIADASYTVALSVRVSANAEDASPTLEAIQEALQRPARPLFIGRKHCLPAPMGVSRVRASSPRDALARIPLSARALRNEPLSIWWTADEEIRGEGVSSQLISHHRDWLNQVHVGQQWMAHGSILPSHLASVSHDEEVLP